MRYYLLDINPEPWAIGDISVGRRNGKMIPIVGRNQQLSLYKEGVADLLRQQDPKMIEGDVRLEFYFWRRLESHDTEGKTRAQTRKADVTNMVKATEDACQGVLFENDRSTKDVRGVIVQASIDIRGRVVIGCGGDDGLNLIEKLGEVMVARIQQLNSNIDPESDLRWITDDQPF